MKLFKVVIPILLLLFHLKSQAQETIECPKFNISMQSNYDSITNTKINNFLNNHMQKIKLVRIKPHHKTDTILDAYNATPITHSREYITYESIIVGDTIEYNMIEDLKKLNESDFIKITQFMFSQATTRTLSGRCGYEPRNGILFLGSNDEFIGFIEICFKCSGYRYTSTLPPIRVNGEDYDELRTLFEHYNIAVE